MKVLNDLINLKGKVAIVTGAVGIGYGISYRLAEAGAKVVVASLLEEEVNKSVSLLKKKGFEVVGVKCDVSEEGDVGKLIVKTIESYGGIDILVNNAGIYPNIPISSMTYADFQRVIDVNLKGVFLCTKYVSEEMINQGRGGRIINITSIDALHPSSVGLAHYDASKHGVWGFTKNAALEFAPYKIWVNAIAPGAIITEGVKNSQAKGPKGAESEEMMHKFLSKIPMGRMGEPDEIGKVALFLASDMASYMTGTQRVVDGGVLLS